MWFKLRVGEKTKRTNREDYCSPKKGQLSSKPPESITVPGGVRHKNEIMGRLLQASDLMEASTAHGQHDV